MPFVVLTSKGYIKRTSNFGPFHGNIVLTSDKEEAFRFTRETDAQRRLSTAYLRTKEADDLGYWYSRKGRDHDKFGGPLTGTVEEV